MPSGLQLRQALRAPAAGEVWDRFVETRELLGAFRPDGCSPLRPPTRTSSWAAAVAPSAGLPSLAPEGLNLNEAYLFHGTSPENAEGIALQGFDLGRAKAAQMFSAGAYLAECSSKADEHASDGVTSSCRAKGQKFMAMVLCRVVLGRVLRLVRGVGREGRGQDLALSLGAADCDSLLGDLEAANGNYREFVVPTSAQIFPEFVLGYRRLYVSRRQPLPVVTRLALSRRHARGLQYRCRGRFAAAAPAATGASELAAAVEASSPRGVRGRSQQPFSAMMRGR